MHTSSIELLFLQRIGTSVKGTVDGTNTFKGTLGSSQFALKPDDSYLFVGAPPKDFTLPADVGSTTLTGGFDNLFVNGRKVGLYDALVSTSSLQQSILTITRNMGQVG